MSERAMPKPNCTEEVGVGTIEFGRLGRRVVEGRFDDGSKRRRGAATGAIVTNLDGHAQALYDELYCQRGEAENRIKEAGVGPSRLYLASH